MSAFVTLLTDFGLKDSYVGVMKGVILSGNPKVTVIDISHEINPQDIGEAAFILYSAFKYFPADTIHVIVVDPGVGSTRRIIGLERDDTLFIAPDNGVLQYIFEESEPYKVYHFNQDKWFGSTISSTFHGRDIFAPLAAHLSRGVDPVEMGTEIDDYTRIGIPRPLRTSRGLEGKVIHCDRFGNMITNIRASDIKGMLKDIEVICGDTQIEGIKNNYSEASRGDLLAVIESNGFLEIAVREGNALERFPKAKKEAVVVKV